MKVTMLQPTFWGGEKLVPGDETEVDEATAKRWKRARIANSTEMDDSGSDPKPDPSPTPDPDPEGDTDPDTDPKPDPSPTPDPDPEGDTEEASDTDVESGPKGPGSNMSLSQLKKSGTPTLQKIARLRGLDISAATNNDTRAQMIFEDINKE